MKLKTLFILFLMPLFIISCKQKDGILEVSVDYDQKEKWASDQFAMWIEDTSGNFINTLFVTQFATTELSYTERGDCVPVWVSKAQPSKMTAEEIDAISTATPVSGIFNHTWDLKDKQGVKVKHGTYVFVLEATLTNNSRVIFKNNIKIGNKPVSVPGIPEYTHPDREKNKDMIRSVIVNYKLIDK